MTRFQALRLLGITAFAVAFAPATGFAQPGRTFTPPPIFTPPPMLTQPPRFTPPPSFTPPTQNFQFQQQTAQRQQENQNSQRNLDFTRQQMSTQQVAQDRMQQDGARRMEQFRGGNQQGARTPQNSGATSSSSGLPFLGGGGEYIPPRPTIEIVVLSVEANSQSAQLGLKRGDILVSYDGELLRSEVHLVQLMRRQPQTGNLAELVIDRAFQQITVEVQPGRLGLVPRTQMPGTR